MTGSPFTVQFRVVLLNSTQFAGQNVTYDVDGTLFTVPVRTNGTHSKAQMQLTGQASGNHTIQVVDPPGCFDPMVVSCGTSSGFAEWDAMDRLWNSTSGGEDVAPSGPELLGNYPNPFNPSTVISYMLTADAHVYVPVYNMLGERVAVLVNERQASGFNRAVFNAASLPSGIYLYELRVDGIPVARKKALFIK